MLDLLSVESHFAFGENWRSFAGLIDDQRIVESDAGIARIFPGKELEGARVLDIGCGSGLPALSLLRAGASHVTCIDLDPSSVAAATETLSRHAPSSAWSTEQRSVFDVSGSYDVVYSWGVLHHTGDMRRAIVHASSLVIPNGILAIAIYAKTPLCGPWRMFKRAYSQWQSPRQQGAQRIYSIVMAALYSVTGRKPKSVGERGMDTSHDIHDWLGGYPYESASLYDIQAFLPGWTLTRHNKRYNPLTLGLLGSGCDEYVLAAPQPESEGHLSPATRLGPV